MQKRKILLPLLLLTVVSCGDSLSGEEKSDIELAEAHIENFELEKAIPYLEKISPDDPEYGKARESLNTINSLYGSTAAEEEASSPIDDQVSRLTEAESQKLITVQEEWAKLQMDNYGNYFTSYRIENPSKVVFVLGKVSSSNGSVEGHEKMHVPILRSAYKESLVENQLPNLPIDISFERRKGAKPVGDNLSASESGWVPAEHLSEGVGIYFGQENEKIFLGRVTRGYTENGQKYIVLDTGDHEEVKTKEFITGNGNCFIKANDPKHKGKYLHYH